MPPPIKFVPVNPKARFAVQTERDPADRDLEAQKVAALRSVVTNLEKIVTRLGALGGDLHRIADTQDPPVATEIAATFSRIPREEPE